MGFKLTLWAIGVIVFFIVKKAMSPPADVVGTYLESSPARNRMLLEADRSYKESNLDLQGVDH